MIYIMIVNRSEMGGTKVWSNSAMWEGRARMSEGPCVECGVRKSGEAESSRRVIDRWEGGGEEVTLLTWGDIGVLGEV